MRFAITGVVSEEVSASVRRVANPFADALRETIAALVLDSKAHLLVFSPIIISEAMGIIANESTYCPRQSGILISRNIDHATWTSSNPAKRMRLYAQALHDGLGYLPPESLSASDIILLREAITQAALVAKQSGA